MAVDVVWVMVVVMVMMVTRNRLEAWLLIFTLHLRSSSCKEIDVERIVHYCLGATSIASPVGPED